MTEQQTFSLEEVAAQVLPPEWSDSVRWLTRRLNRGELRGYRVGRVWRMTSDDVEFLIAKHRQVVTVPAAPAAVEPASVTFLDGLSARSRNRLRGRSA